MTAPASLFKEPARSLPVAAHYDVIVCGGGPAGVAAALSAARAGARTALVEAQGCLGGVWTSGLLSIILDGQNKPGLMREIRQRLHEMDAIREDRDIYQAEAMKVALEAMCEEAGVDVRLYSRLTAAGVEGRMLRHVVLEAKEGRFALEGRCFVDATGDGDLGALAGCGFDFGRATDGLTQPMTLMALITHLPASLLEAPLARDRNSCMDKGEFLAKLKGIGVSPSYTKPSLFLLPGGIGALMINHVYEKSGLSSRDLTRASIDARREVNEIVRNMRRLSEEWSRVTLVATAAHIGVREGRRIHGDYQVNVKDVGAGRRFADGIARVTFPVDVHSVRQADGGGYGEDHAPCLPYDIPLRALVARDRDNLFLAGRCISGDFHAHASYRVTGNAVITGEAAGRAAARAAQLGQDAHTVAAGPLAPWLGDLLPQP